MNAYQCQEMFPSIDLDVIQMVIENHRGDQEKILAALLQMTPKDKRTIRRVKEKLKLFQSQHWQVTSSRGLNIRTLPSMSIATPVVGALKAGEYIEELEHRETKAGKLWVKHARGWSLATRKGEVGMRRVKNPYAHLNIDQIVEESEKMPKKEKKVEKKPKKKKSRKKKVDKKAPQTAKPKGAITKDPFAENDPFDPFVKAAGGATTGSQTSNGFPAPSSSLQHRRHTQNQDPQLQNLAISKPQKETMVISGLSPTHENMGKGGLETFFDNKVDDPSALGGQSSQSPVNIMDDLLAASAAPTPAKKEEAKVDLWGGDLLNLDDVTKEKKKAKSHVLTLREIQGEEITVAKGPGGPMPVGPGAMGAPPMPKRKGTLDVFFTGSDPFAQNPAGSMNQQQQMMAQQNMMAQRNLMMQQQMMAQQNMMMRQNMMMQQQNPFMQQQPSSAQAADPFQNLAWQQQRQQ